MKRRWLYGPLCFLVFLLTLIASASTVTENVYRNYAIDRIWFYQSELVPEATPENRQPAWYYLWKSRSLKHQKASGSIPTYLLFKTNGPNDQRRLSEKNIPKQMLKFYWRWQTTDSTSQLFSMPLCFTSLNSDFALIESEFRDAVSINCKSPANNKRALKFCEITFNAVEQQSTLVVVNGRLHSHCTEYIWKKYWHPVTEAKVALITYNPEVIPPQAQPQQNSSLPSIPEGKTSDGQLLESSSAGYGNDFYDDRKKGGPPLVIGQLDLLIALPGLPDDLESLAGDEDPSIHWQFTDQQNDVVVSFYLAGQLQQIHLSLDQWQLLVEHGVHRSPVLLQHLMTQLFQGKVQLDNLNRELNDLLDDEEQSYRAASTPEEQEQARSQIADALEWLNEIPPEQLSLGNGLQSLYEQQVQTLANWTPTSEEQETFVSQSGYLDFLRNILTLFSRTDVSSTDVSSSDVSSSDASSTDALPSEPEQRVFDYIKPLSLYDLEELLTRQLAHNRFEWAFKLAVSYHDSLTGPANQNDNIDTETTSDGVITTPGKEEGKSQAEHQQAPVNTASPFSPNTVAHFAPTSTTGSATGQGQPNSPERQESSLTEAMAPNLATVAAERLDIRSNADGLHPQQSCRERTDILMSSLPPLLRTELQQFLTMLLPWGDSGHFSWELAAQYGLLNKGLVLTILWAHGLPEDHEFIRRIRDGGMIMQNLKRHGLNANRQVFNLPDSSLTDALMLTSQAMTETPTLWHQLHLNHATSGGLLPFFVWKKLTYSSGPEMYRLGELLPHHNHLALSEETRIRIHNARREPGSLTDESLEEGMGAMSLDPGLQPGWFKTLAEDRVTEIVQNLLYSTRHLRGVELRDILHIGGSCVVFRVRRNDRNYLLKYVFIEDEEQQSTLARSAWVIDFLLHDPLFNNVVQIQEFLADKKTYVQLMMPAEQTLDQVLSGKRLLAENFYHQYFKPLLLQVQYLHSRNIFHLDLKPENIGIMKDGKLVILDLDQLVIPDKLDQVPYSRFAGTPEYSCASMTHTTLEEQGNYSARSQDYAGLAHIWLYGRLKQSVFSVYFQHLEAFDENLHAIYKSSKVVRLSQTDRLEIAESLYRYLQHHGLETLFTIAGFQLRTVDREIANPLWLAPLSAPTTDSELSSLVGKFDGRIEEVTVKRQQQANSLVQSPPHEKQSILSCNTPLSWNSLPLARQWVTSKELRYWLIKVAQIIHVLHNSFSNGSYWSQLDVTMVVHGAGNPEIGLDIQHPTSPLSEADFWKEMHSNLRGIVILTHHLLSAYAPNTPPICAIVDDRCLATLNNLLGLADLPSALTSDDLFPAQATPDARIYLNAYFEHGVSTLAESYRLLDQFLSSLHNYLFRSTPSGQSSDQDIHTLRQDIAWYREQLEQEKRSLKEQIDALYQHYNHEVRNMAENPTAMESWLNRRVQESDIQTWFGQSVYYQELLALLRGNATGYYPQAGRASAIPQEHLTRRHIILALRALNAEQDFYRTPDNEFYLRDAVMTAPSEQLVRRLPDCRFITQLKYARKAQILHNKGVTANNMVELIRHHPALPCSECVEPSSLSHHLYSVLLRWHDWLQVRHPQDTNMLLDRTLFNLESLFPGNQVQPEVTQGRCPNCQNFLQVVAGRQLSNVYYSKKGDSFGIQCDACKDVPMSISYRDRQAHISDTQVSHCARCLLDLCRSCVAEPARCPEPQCGKTMFPATLAHLTQLDHQYASGVRCNQCRKRVSFGTGVNQDRAAWHCSSNHDLCTPCHNKNRQARERNIHPGQEGAGGQDSSSCCYCGRALSPNEPIHNYSPSGCQLVAHPQCHLEFSAVQKY